MGQGLCVVDLQRGAGAGGASPLHALDAARPGQLGARVDHQAAIGRKRQGGGRLGVRGLRQAGQGGDEAGQHQRCGAARPCVGDVRHTGNVRMGVGAVCMAALGAGC